MQLTDHIVLVTGALGTLGSAMCKAIEAAGGKAHPQRLAARQGRHRAGRHRGGRLEGGDGGIGRTHGRLDDLVNNAGIRHARRWSRRRSQWSP
jgi:NADP-dependent 3-hydroxy acid dehydrogenase YdfG